MSGGDERGGVREGGGDVRERVCFEVCYKKKCTRF